MPSNPWTDRPLNTSFVPCEQCRRVYVIEGKCKKCQKWENEIEKWRVIYGKRIPNTD